MSLLERIIVAHRCRSTHHYIAMDALSQITGPQAERWRNLMLVHNKELLDGAKAPDAVFKDFKNHVLHVGEGEWGGARDAGVEWYGEAVARLREKKWDKAIYALGVLSHYYADPIQPFHTGQTEEEGAMHRAVEWSIAKSRATIKDRIEEIGYPAIIAGQGVGFVSDMVLAGAEKSHPYYQTLLDHYNLDVGVKNPPAGLDQTLIDIVAELVAYATAGLGVLFSRAFAEAGVAAPKTHITVPGYLATLDIPLRWITRKLDDAGDKRIVTKMYREYKETGKVIKTLPEDDKAIRKLHARQVLRRPLEELDAQALKPMGQKYKPRPEYVELVEQIAEDLAPESANILRPAQMIALELLDETPVEQVLEERVEEAVEAVELTEVAPAPPAKLKKPVIRIAGVVSALADKPDADEVMADQAKALEAAALAEKERLEAAEKRESEIAAKREAEQAEAARLEAIRVEAARIEAVKLETEKLEAERLEKERLAKEEAAHLEEIRLEAAKLEAARLEAIKLEAERVEAERLETARLEAERLEAERLAAEEVARVEAEELARIEAIETEKREEAARLEAEELARIEAEQEAERLNHAREQARLAEAERRETEALKQASADEVVRLEEERSAARKLADEEAAWAAMLAAEEVEQAAEQNLDEDFRQDEADLGDEDEIVEDEFTLEELAAFDTNLTDGEAQIPPPERQAPPVETFFENADRTPHSGRSRARLTRDDPVIDAPSIGKKTARRLNRVGIFTVADLLDCDVEEIAFELDVRHIDEPTLEDWKAQAVLMIEVAGLRVHDAQILVGAGIRNGEDLANASATRIFHASMGFLKTNEGARIVRDDHVLEEAEVRDWIDMAKETEAA